MNNKTKLAVVAAAALTLTTVGFALPTLATSSTSSSDISSTHEEGHRGDHADRDHVTLSATITGVPSNVTSSHEAHRGAYFTAFVIDDAATSAPAQMPSSEGRRIGIHPVRNADGTVSTQIKNGSFSGTLGFHFDETGVTKLALYPSDGSAAVLVTITVDASGVATAKASSALEVAYSATIAAEMPSKGDRHGVREGHGPSSGRGHGDGHGRGGKDH
jgi:Spy/CpxP family protein refolding chaperone